MSADPNHFAWTKLANITSNVGQPFINKHDHVILPIKAGRELYRFLRYDSIKDKCIQIWKLDNPIDCWPNSYAVDIENEIMYIPTTKGIFTFNLKKNTVNINEMPKNDGDIDDEDIKSAFIAGKLHIFQFDSGSAIHTIYDPKSHEYEDQEIEIEDYSFDTGCMLHIPSQNKLIFFGGSLDADIVSFDLDTYEFMKINTLKSILIHDEPGVVLTKDERYIIIFCWQRKKRKVVSRKANIEIIDMK